MYIELVAISLTSGLYKNIFYILRRLAGSSKHWGILVFNTFSACDRAHDT